jgi:fatty-acyl-CoA synthase
MSGEHAREHQRPHVIGSNVLLDPALGRAAHDPNPAFAFFSSGGAWEEISYRGFIARALRFSELLRGAGVVRDDVVFIVLQHGFDAHAAFVGTMLIGAIPSYLPFPNAKQDVSLYWEHHRAVFRHTAPTALIVYGALRDTLATNVTDLRSKILTPEDADAVAPARHIELPPDSATALLQHSSGTTGLKKGVALSYAAIALQLDSYAQALRLHEVDRPVFASWLPLYHDMGLIASFLMPLKFGIPIVSLDPFEWVRRPQSILDGIERYRATHAWFPNFAFLHVVASIPQQYRADLSSLNALINCSEPCKPRAFDVFEERFRGSNLRPGVLQTCYATAETVFAISQSTPGLPVRSTRVDATCVESLAGTARPANGTAGVTLLSNGPPLDGCEIAVLHDGEILGELSIGEIVVKARFLFTGYYKNESATREAFFGDWYRTGDIGFIEGGEVFIIGRIKDVIIVNGKNVFAHDVEAAVSNISGLKRGRAVAFGFFDERVGSEQLIVVAERGEDPVSATTISSAVNRAVLDELGIPCSDVRVVDQGWLVKTTSGKISRSENATKYARTLRARPASDRIP